MAKAKTEALIARGISRLLADEGQTLTETQFLEACGRGASKKKLREKLDELIAARSLGEDERGGRRWIEVPEEAVPSLLRFVLEHLQDNARCVGSEVRYLAKLAVDSLSVRAAPENRDTLTNTRLGKREDRVLEQIVKLAKKKKNGGRVKVVDLLEPLGFKSAVQLAGPLQKLAQSGRIVLDPLMNPMAVPAAEKAKSLHLPGHGLIFYVSLSQAWKKSVESASRS